MSSPVIDEENNKTPTRRRVLRPPRQRIVQHSPSSSSSSSSYTSSTSSSASSSSSSSADNSPSVAVKKRPQTFRKNFGNQSLKRQNNNNVSKNRERTENFNDTSNDFFIEPIDTPIIETKINSYNIDENEYLNVDINNTDNIRKVLKEEEEKEEIDWKSKNTVVLQTKKNNGFTPKPPPNKGEPKFKRRPLGRSKGPKESGIQIINDEEQISNEKDEQFQFELNNENNDENNEFEIKSEDKEKCQNNEANKSSSKNKEDNINKEIGTFEIIFNDEKENEIKEEEEKERELIKNDQKIEAEIINSTPQKNRNDVISNEFDIKQFFTYDTYMNSRLTIKGRSYEFTFYQNLDILYIAKYFSFEEKILIFTKNIANYSNNNNNNNNNNDVEISKLFSECTKPDFVILIANGKRDFSLRKESITGLEYMTFRVAHENAKNSNKSEYVVYCYEKENMFTPIKLIGRNENGPDNINFIDTLHVEPVMKVIKINKGYINVTANGVVNPLRSFAIAISFFLS